jgi:hypothetical protein
MVHLINYEGTDFPSFSEVPLVSSQYEGRLERKSSNYWKSVFSPILGPRNFSPILKLHLCPRNCKCEAHFYLRPPTQVNSSLVTASRSGRRNGPQLYVPYEYFSPIKYLGVGIYNLNSLTHSRESYHILIAKAGGEDSFLWEFAMSGIVTYYPITRLLKVTEDERKMFLGERSLGFGAKVRRFTEVELVTNIRELEKCYHHINLAGGQASNWAVRLGNLLIQREDLLRGTEDFPLFQKIIGNFTLIQPHNRATRKNWIVSLVIQG